MRGQPVRVVQGGVGIVDRARSDDDEQPVVPAVEDVDDLGAGPDDGVGDGAVDRELVAQQRGGQQRADPGDAVVVQRRSGGDSHDGGVLS